MKFSVLSGAYKNAGDFLIVERSVKLLRHVYPDCEIQLYERRRPLDASLEEINRSDALIFAGGPAYSPSIYPDEIPLVADLEQIKVPMYTIGLGWYGADSADETLYRDYTFSQPTRALLTRLQQDGTLTCRDWYTVRALKANGFTRTRMTGCPAWYDLDSIHRTELREGIQLPYRKICFSDPANVANLPQSMEIVQYIRAKYPDARLVYVFHRGIRKDTMTDAYTAEQYERFAEQLEQLGVQVKDIAYSSEGFHIYDNCDLHIGMRVHAHIYNLSIRNISVLIEEDGRGAGVNEALGLFPIKPYQSLGLVPARSRAFRDRVIRTLCRRAYGSETVNPYLLQRLDDVLFMLEESDYQPLRQVFRIQQDYFDVMCKHIAEFAR